MNSLHDRFVTLHRDVTGRVETLTGERAKLIEGRQTLAAQRTELQAHVSELATELEQLRSTVNHTFVNLSLRTLGLVERQLGVIESLEEREQDPERLATLFKLDHMATVMRRYSENMLVLARGARHRPRRTDPAGRRGARRRQRDRAVRARHHPVAAAARPDRRVRRRRPQPPAGRTPGERHRLLAPGLPGRAVRLAAGER